MATIHRTIELTSSADDVWAKLADVGAANKIFPFLGDVTVEGDRRVCSLGDDGKLDELIVTVDHERRRLVYAIVDSPFPMTQHSAAMQVLETDGGCTFDWNFDFKPDELVPAVTEIVDGAVEALRRTLA